MNVYESHFKSISSNITLRRDWLASFDKSSTLDLSSNVCYDKFINRDYRKDDSNYPDDSLSYIHLSNHYKVNPRNIAIGYGSSELILRILTIYKEKTIHIVTPTWQLAELYAVHLGMKIKENADILYLANPNGLTGKVLSRQEVLLLLKKYSLVILDEAYGDFSKESLSDIASDFDNLIVIKTLSKTIASPGLRVGYCFSNEKIIQFIQNARPGYVTSSQTASALEHLLPQIDLHIDRMLETRKYIETNYSVDPSQGNYVLFKEDPKFPVVMKKIGNLYRMALVDIATFKEFENGN